MDSETQPAAATRDTGQTPRSSLGSESRQTLADQLRQQASDRLSGGKDRAVHGLTSLADAVRQTGQQLRDKDQAGIATYIESLADQATQFSESLGHKDLGEIVEDVQRFAHRRPALFLGLSFGLGVAGARFLKSSRPRQQGSPTSGAATGRQDAATGTSYGGSGSGYSTGPAFDRAANPSARPTPSRMGIAQPQHAPNPGSSGASNLGSTGSGTSASGRVASGASEFRSSGAEVPESAISSTAGSTDRNETVGAATGEISRNTAAPRTARRPRTEQ